MNHNSGSPKTSGRTATSTVITRPAALARQGSLRIFATTLRVKDLRLPNFYQIEKLDPKDDKGFQRVLNEARARRLADYLREAHESKEAFLPTSIFLATDKDIQFNERDNTITFDVAHVGAFSVVDGQHRIAGLVAAAEANPDLNDFEVLANIAVNLDPISQMCHFLIVNTTQKSVDKAVEQQIYARLSGMVNIEQIPALPSWIKRQINKGDDKRALVLANYLNGEPSSPWYQKIQMANETDDQETATIQQKSFVGSIKKYVISSNNPFGDPQWETDKQPKILANYWRAVTDLLVDQSAEEETVLFKTIGVDLFHIVSGTVFQYLLKEGDYRVDTIKSVLNGGFKNLPDEYIGIGRPEWWLSGNEASGVNTAAVRKIAQALSHAINSQGRSEKKIAV